MDLEELIYFLKDKVNEEGTEVVLTKEQLNLTIDHLVDYLTLMDYQEDHSSDVW